MAISFHAASTGSEINSATSYTLSLPTVSHGDCLLAVVSHTLGTQAASRLAVKGAGCSGAATTQALRKLTDPANYLGAAQAMIDRVLAGRGKPQH